MFSRALLVISLLTAVVCQAHPGHDHHDHHHEHVELPEGTISTLPQHHCIHDDPKMQKLIYYNGEDKIAPQPETKNFHELAVGPLRIVLSTVDLTTTGRSCAVVGGTSPDFQGGTTVCTADDILTTEKRNILMNNILPAAMSKLTGFLRVNQLTSNLIVPAAACSVFTIPSAHTTTGVANADYVLYVAAGPTAGSTVAWAGYCRTDASGRPIIGRANFGPKHITWSTTNPAANELVVGTAVHEIMHALGFSDFFMQNGFVGGPKRTTATARGKTVNLFTGTKALAAARTYYNCPTMTGVELEDEGSSGSALSHWDRRNALDDVMAPVVGPSRITAVTMGYFEDTGVYTVDYTRAESATWGKNGGCSLFTEKCNTVGGGLGKWFCNTANAKSCTPDRKSIGYCGVSTYSAALPTAFQYFADVRQGGLQFMDYCPYIQGYSNRICNVDVAETANDIIFGFYYGPGGRCADVTGLIQTGYGGDGGAQRCLQMRCPSGTRVQLRVASSPWVDCPLDGSAGTIPAPSGYSGTISCPAAASVCDADLMFGTAAPTASTTRPPTTASPPAAPTTAAPPAAPGVTTTRPPTTVGPAPTTTRAPTTTAGASNCDTSYLLPTTQPSPSKVLGVASINGILRRHNNARREVSPSANVMPMLKWNQKLADFAQQYMSTCIGMVHSSNQVRQNLTRFGFSYVGENLAAGSSTLYNAANGGAESTKLWVAEKADWLGVGQKCRTGKVCGHYTQVIWAATTDVGCGYAFCPSLPYKNYWSCVYGSGGNYVGQNEYATGGTPNVCQLAPGATTAAPFATVNSASSTPAPVSGISGVQGELTMTIPNPEPVLGDDETKEELRRRLGADLTSKLEKPVEVKTIRYFGNDNVNAQFEVQDATQQEVDAKMQTARTDVEWLSETSALFVEITGQGPQAISNVNVETTPEPAAVASESTCGPTCIGFAVAASVGGLGVVGAVVFAVMRSAASRAASVVMSSNEPTRDVRAPTAV